MRQLDSDDVTRMAPILSHRDGVAKRIHCIEDQQVGVPIEFDKRVGFVQARVLVLAIRRIDDRLAPSGEAVTERITRVKLFDRGDREASYLVTSARLQGDELDIRGKRVEIHGKPGRRVLGAQRFAQYVMTTVDANPISGNVCGREEWETHDVVPMGVGQKYVEGVLALGAMLPEHAVAEFAYARAEITQQVFIAAADNFDAARVAAKGAANRKGQRLVDKGVNGFRRVEPMANGSQEGVADFAPYGVFVQRRR